MLALLGLVAAQRSATVHEVQPSARDRVHAIWLNRPTFSGKLGTSAWPTFEAGVATRSGTMCAAREDARYSGYDESGLYCEAASTALDDDAHLLLHSGRLGVVVDVGGLKAPASSHARNLLPRLGATPGTAATPRAVYDALDTISEKKRLVFALYEFDGMPLEEIAKTVGAGINTVKSRLFHARREIFAHVKRKGLLPTHTLQVIK